MVRKIKTQKKEKEKIEIKLPKMNMKELLANNNRINKQLDKALELVSKNVGESYSKKMNLLTLNSAREEFLDRCIDILQTIYLTYINRKNILTNQEDIEIMSIEEINIVKDFIKLYEKNYVPKATTLYFLNFFIINKTLEKYFKRNYFKKRFNAENKSIYNISEYKELNKGFKNKNIEKVDTYFVGVWEEQIEKIFRDLDYILDVLNGYRERYIPIKECNKKYKETRDSFKTTPDEERIYTKKELRYIKKIFKEFPDIIESYNIPIIEKYKNEYDTIIECMIYVALNSDKENLDLLEDSLVRTSGSKQKAKIIAKQAKQVTDNIHIFLRNFEKLVCEGDDTFDLTIKKAEINVV